MALELRDLSSLENEKGQKKSLIKQINPERWLYFVVVSHTSSSISDLMQQIKLKALRTMFRMDIGGLFWTLQQSLLESFELH